MNDDAEKNAAKDSPGSPEKGRRRPWRAFTLRGVAAFAHVRLSTIFFVQGMMALIAAATVVWFLNANYVPSITEAIQNLPEGAVFQDGKLTNITSGALSRQKFLSFAIDLEETGRTGQTADMQVELRRDYFQVCSLLGCALFVYPAKQIPIGRSTSEPWWGARQPVILAICGALVFAQVWLSWMILAILYAPIAKLIAWFSDRKLSWGGSWCLVSLAQMPGAVLMTIAIFLYGIQAFDLIRFLFFFALHFVVAWIYLAAALFALPRVTAREGTVVANPFQ